MNMLSRVLMIAFLGAAIAQDYQDYQENTPRSAPIRLRPSSGTADAPKPTPIAILKQINKHNEDGSYTYGYEGADGSFKIETKLATGEVKGKYGYVDETGKVRVVEYGANKYGFQPSGEGITVAPPTLVDETTKDLPDYEDEPQQPQRQFRVQKPQQQYRPAPQPQPRPQPQYVQYDEEESEPEPPRRPQPQSQPQYAPQPQQGPVPPRIQIPSARTTDVLYSPQQRPARPESGYSQSQSFGDGPSSVRVSRPYYAPAPSPAPLSARAQGFHSQPSPRPAVEPLNFGPPQQARPVQQTIQYQQQPQSHHQPQGRSPSLLDQLAKDYALPQGGAQPLHDISFGYY